MTFVRAGLEFVDLSGEDEVAFSQSVDLMSPDRDLGVSPAKTNIGMMSLLFGEFAYSDPLGYALTAVVIARHWFAARKAEIAAA